MVLNENLIMLCFCGPFFKMVFVWLFRTCRGSNMSAPLVADIEDLT